MRYSVNRKKTDFTITVSLSLDNYKFLKEYSQKFLNTKQIYKAVNQALKFALLNLSEFEQFLREYKKQRKKKLKTIKYISIRRDAYLTVENLKYSQNFSDSVIIDSAIAFFIKKKNEQKTA